MGRPRAARARTRRHELVARREALGWTTSVLATRAGVARGLLYRVESGEVNLPVYALLRVSLALGCTAWDLTELPDLDDNPVVVPGRPHAPAGAA